MSGCSLPVDASLENINTVMNTVRKIEYPVNYDHSRELLYEPTVD